MFRQRFQLGLLHMSIALTALPIDGTLNRVMISELEIPATLVAVLITLPYLFSPIQLAIGSFADRHPLFGRRRTPYIIIGVVLSAAGLALAAPAVFLLDANFSLGLLVSLLAFGLWGTGFNFATVSYFALASEISGEQRSSRTIATMYFMMILTMIVTGITLGRALETYTPFTLNVAVWVVAAIALAIGLLGVVGLEPRRIEDAQPQPSTERASIGAFIPLVVSNPPARLFFIYMIVLLAAILGQDVLLEPFAADALGLPISATTRLSSIYGVAFLLALVAGGWSEGRISKRRVAAGSAWAGIAAFAFIIAGGLLASTALFYTGVLILGTAIGLSTVSNHALMLDMTTPQNVGLFIGAWGMATAFARLVGSITGGVLQDLVSPLSTLPGAGYMTMFLINIGLLALSLVLLSRLDVGRFRSQAEADAPTGDVIEQAALAARALE